LRARNGQKDAKASARLVRVVAVVSKPGESSASRLWTKLKTRRPVTNYQLKLGLEGRIGSPHDSQTNQSRSVPGVNCVHNRLETCKAVAHQTVGDAKDM
jgi:hypothetical protein